MTLKCDCGCQVTWTVVGPDRIWGAQLEYCGVHNAAHNMLTALKRLRDETELERCHLDIVQVAIAQATPN